jgi:trehalose/maltose hydrolase-like predicted phosphorylase
VSLTPENWSGRVTIRTAIDGRIVNSGARLYRPFNNTHLVPVSSEAGTDNTLCLLVRTSQSNVHVAQAARTEVILEGQRVEIQRRSLEEPGYVAQELTADVAQGQTLVVEKVVSLYTSRDHAISEPAREARTTVARAGLFADLMVAHVRAWKHLWRRFDVHIEPVQPERLNVLILLRLNMFHLLQTVSPHSIGLDIGVPARGLTGEAYQGHVFWDELFIFPFFNHRMPEITRSLLLYRYRRLDEARAAARRAGFQGAMFPWQSGSNGEEVTQVQNLNSRSGRWMADNSYLQRHIGSAVAYNVWQYFQVTQDLEFLEFYGAELILEIARFWSSVAQFNEVHGRYEIHGVMGPDEYHDGYPDVSRPGLANNAYTNVMAVWVLWRALDALKQLSPIRRAELTASLGLTSGEIARWDTISRRTSGISTRTRPDSANRRLLRRPHIAWINTLSRGSFLGPGAVEPSPLHELLRGGAAERCDRHPAGHDPGGRAPRCHGRNGRSRATGLNWYRGCRRCAPVQSHTAAGDGPPRYACSLSGAFARCAADA